MFELIATVNQQNLNLRCRALRKLALLTSLALTACVARQGGYQAVTRIEDACLSGSVDVFLLSGGSPLGYAENYWDVPPGPCPMLTQYDEDLPRTTTDLDRVFELWTQRARMKDVDGVVHYRDCRTFGDSWKRFQLRLLPEQVTDDVIELICPSMARSAFDQHPVLRDYVVLGSREPILGNYFVDQRIFLMTREVFSAGPELGQIGEIAPFVAARLVEEGVPFSLCYAGLVGGWSFTTTSLEYAAEISRICEQEFGLE